MIHPEYEREPQGRRRRGNTFPIGDVPTVNSGEQITPGAADEFLWLTPSVCGHMEGRPPCEQD